MSTGIIMAELKLGLEGDATSTSSTSSSSTTNSAAPLIKTRKGVHNRRDLVYWIRVGCWILLALFLAAVVFFAWMGVQKLHNDIESIKCYECISFHGKLRDNEPGLPYEQNCFHNPKNKRLCNPGNICSVVMVKATSFTRFHRACSNQKKIGCTKQYKKGNVTACFCNTSLCTLGSKFV